jgi:hypothetical protein
MHQGRNSAPLMFEESLTQQHFCRLRQERFRPVRLSEHLIVPFWPLRHAVVPPADTAVGGVSSNHLFSLLHWALPVLATAPEKRTRCYVGVEDLL